MPDPDELPEIDFPAVDWDDEELDTRPMPLHEQPLQARIDREIAHVAAHYPRVAAGIENFWGQRDCVAYIQSLIFNGYKEGESRLGFKEDVVTALMNLVEMHKRAFGEQGAP